MQSDESGCYKIGVSKNPHKRRKQHQTGNAENISIIHVFESENPHLLETTLKNYYSPFKKTGEWFSFSLEEEIGFLELCKKYEETFKFLKENNTYFK